MQKHIRSTAGQVSDVARRVAQAIESRKGTLRDFSEKSGIPYPSLLEYASEKKKPGLDALVAIIKASDVSPLWLLTGEGEMFGHRITSAGKPLYVDGRLLSRIAVELQLVAALTGSAEGDLTKLAVTTLQLDLVAYELLVAKETGTDPRELRQRIAETEDKAVLAATIYNLFADLTDQAERDRRIREQAYELLRMMHHPRAERVAKNMAKQNSRGTRTARRGKSTNTGGNTNA